MTFMFEYIVLMEFTYELENGDEVEALEIAKYNFDLGLEEGEEIQLDDICILGKKETSHTGLGVVKKKVKAIKQHEDGDIFTINVFVEIADKDKFEKIRGLLKHYRVNKL
jgi:hypothetical protein